MLFSVICRTKIYFPFIAEGIPRHTGYETIPAGGIFMDEREAWERFAHTGSVSSYLSYCKVKQEASASVASEEDRHDNQYRRSGDRREDSGGK